MKNSHTTTSSNVNGIQTTVFPACVVPKAAKASSTKLLFIPCAFHCTDWVASYLSMHIVYNTRRKLVKHIVQLHQTNVFNDIETSTSACIKFWLLGSQYPTMMR